MTVYYYKYIIVVFLWITKYFLISASMKKILSFSTIFILFIGIFSSAFAIETPQNFNINSTTETSATLSWDEIDTAAAYSLYYGTTSGELTQYDLIETSPHLLSGLQENTTYFATISANDDNFEESVHSEEISFTTGWNGVSNTGESFALESIELISETKLKLMFSADLDSSDEAIREFKIVNKFDDLEELIVLDSEIDAENENILLLTMEESIPTSAQYNVTVVRLSDVDGNNIQNGIDGIESFYTPDSYEELVEEPEVLAAAGPEEPIQEVSGGSSWANLSDDQLAKTTQVTADEAEELPTTGAEHWFIAILALLLWAMMFGYKFQKS